MEVTYAYRIGGAPGGQKRNIHLTLHSEPTFGTNITTQLLKLTPAMAMLTLTYVMITQPCCAYATITKPHLLA